MTNDFTELLSSIKDFDRRLSHLETFNQVKTIKDGNGTTIIDPTGLNSLSNFKRAQVFNGAAGLSTASTSFVDVSGSSLSALTLTRTTNVLVYLMGYGFNDAVISNNLNSNLELQLYDSSIGNSRANVIIFGSTATDLWVDGGGFLNWSEAVGNELVFNLGVLEFEAGTHNLKLQYKANGSGTAHLNAWIIGYIVLGT